MSYGEIIFSPLGVHIAALNADNSYGTPALVDYVQKVNFTPEFDDDTIKAYGVNLEAAAWAIGGESEIEEASLSQLAKDIAMGTTPSTSGVTPNEIKQITIVGGGAGHPYIGIVYIFAATDGSAVVLACPKSMLAEAPEWEVEQNKFRTGEMKLTHLAGSQTLKNIYRYELYESASDLPDFSLAASFDALMGDMF